MKEKDIYENFIDTILDITLSDVCKDLAINRTSVSNKSCSLEKLKKIANYIVIKYQLAIIDFNKDKFNYENNERKERKEN